MSNINAVSLTGNIVADAQLNQTTGNGTAVLNLSIAVNDRRKNNETGEWEDHPNFVDCSMFGNRATSLAPYLKKGTKVAIQGSLRQNTWTDKDTGKNRSRITVLINEIEFMSNRKDDDGHAAPAKQAAAAPTPVVDDYGDDEDVPF